MWKYDSDSSTHMGTHVKEKEDFVEVERLLPETGVILHI